MVKTFVVAIPDLFPSEIKRAFWAVAIDIGYALALTIEVDLGTALFKKSLFEIDVLR